MHVELDQSVFATVITRVFASNLDWFKLLYKYTTLWSLVQFIASMFSA
jgi:hypothetical protein